MWNVECGMCQSRRRLGRSVNWENECEYASAGFAMLHVNPAPMRKGDLPGKTETNARATWFCAKKRYKYLIKGLWRHTATVICDGDADLPIVELSAI